ncbi:MAG: DUF5686 family protein [Balneolaceae bacterium]|nr:DUF5686 family protein [Balneolaceae bacterium]
MPNFYDDDIDVASYDVMGVTHPDALDYYRYEIVDRTTLDGKTVYEMKVTPRRKLQPLFEGTIWVLDEEYALLEVRLRPNDVVNFPPPIRGFDTYYEQQFDNYGREFWLPVDMRIEGSVKISMIGLEFPRIAFRQVARITDYRVNEGVPDSLYEQGGTFAVDTTSVAGDNLAGRRLEPIPSRGSRRKPMPTSTVRPPSRRLSSPRVFSSPCWTLTCRTMATAAPAGEAGADPVRAVQAGVQEADSVSRGACRRTRASTGWTNSMRVPATRWKWLTTWTFSWAAATVPATARGATGVAWPTLSPGEKDSASASPPPGAPARPPVSTPSCTIPT